VWCGVCGSVLLSRIVADAAALVESGSVLQYVLHRVLQRVLQRVLLCVLQCVLQGVAGP